MENDSTANNAARAICLLLFTSGISCSSAKAPTPKNAEVKVNCGRQMYFCIKNIKSRKYKIMPKKTLFFSYAFFMM